MAPDYWRYLRIRLTRLEQKWTGGGAKAVDLARRPLGPRLRGALNRDQPPEQEETVTAKRAAVGLKQPMEGCLNGVSGAYVSKIDGSAMRTARGE